MLKSAAKTLAKLVQRSNFPISDASDVRRDFQQAASQALGKQ